MTFNYHISVNLPIATFEAIQRGELKLLTLIMPANALSLDNTAFVARSNVDLGLSNDTSLTTFTIDGNAVTNGGTLNLPNGTTAVALVATPTHPGATVSLIVGDSGLTTGDNALTFRVTAEDGVTTQDYAVTLHVLTAGVAESISIDFTGLNGGGFMTGSEGLFMVVSDATRRVAFWGQVGTETQPDASAYGVTHYVSVNLSDGMSAGDLATMFAYYLGVEGWTASVVGPSDPIVIATDAAVGARVDATNGPGFTTVTVTTQGEDPS